jgi:hypothetical protein
MLKKTISQQKQCNMQLQMACMVPLRKDLLVSQLRVGATEEQEWGGLQQQAPMEPEG